LLSDALWTVVALALGEEVMKALRVVQPSLDLRYAGTEATLAKHDLPSRPVSQPQLASRGLDNLKALLVGAII